MKTKSLIFLAILPTMFFMTSPLYTNEFNISGKPRIIDGDTIEINFIKLRFSDIDAVELNQTCVKNNVVWECGKEAKKFLEKTINNNEVFCEAEGKDFYGRLLATCYVTDNRNKNINLNKLMIEQGFAVTYKSSKYKWEEILAKNNRRNIWSGEFESPEIYRKKTKKSSI